MITWNFQLPYNVNENNQRWLDTMKIGICDAMWDKLRVTLMGHAEKKSRDHVIASSGWWSYQAGRVTPPHEVH